MKIAILRLSSIGDIVFTTPVLDALKEKYPDADIDYIVDKRFVEAIEGNKHISNIILFDKKKNNSFSGLIKFGKELKKNKYDLVLDLHSKIKTKIIAAAIGSKVISHKKRPLMQSILVKLKMIQYKPKAPTIKSYFNSLEKLGLEYKGEKLSFDFKDEAMKKTNSYTDFVVFAPGASKNNKKWPVEYFIKLGKLINDSNSGIKNILLLGSGNENDELQKIADGIGTNVVNLAGKLRLKESAATISRAKYIVANDSGLFHIARALSEKENELKVYGLFGSTNPELFEFNSKTKVFYTGEPCSPCSLYGEDSCPKGHYDCMMKITPEMVFEGIKK